MDTNLFYKMKLFLYQKPYSILRILVVLILISGTFWYFNGQKRAHDTSFGKKEKVWQTVKVEAAHDFASIKLPAKAKSNQFAVISPRRAGIIQDLLVDIGDEVSKGQVIGSMLPEGVEGQSSAAINEASSRLQKARAELDQAKGVATNAISVATTQVKESTLQSSTQTVLDQEAQKQIFEKKAEAILVATQAWENIKILLFGNGSNFENRSIQGNFSHSIQKTKVENLADEIQRMEESDQWKNPDVVVEHLSHLENFLTQTEILYKNAIEGGNMTTSQINANISTIQAQQLKVSQAKQSILALEEKSKRFASLQAEREAGAERSKEVLDLVQSQQNLSITQAEKNVEVALANYNAALVKSGHQSITSPFGGIITARMAEVGQAVSTSMPLFYLEGVQTARSQESLSEIHFSLPESWREKVSVGDMVEIKSMEGKSFEGKIFRLSTQIDLNTNSIMATAIAFEKTYEEEVLENTEPEGDKGDAELSVAQEKEKKEVIIPIHFHHGQSLFVSITASDSNIFTVPTLALKKRKNAYFLWKMEEENPVQLQVEVVAEDGESSQVFSQELTIDDAVISNPSVSLFTK